MKIGKTFSLQYNNFLMDKKVFETEKANIETDIYFKKTISSIMKSNKIMPSLELQKNIINLKINFCSFLILTFVLFFIFFILR
jgi:hypothetical protein